MFGNPALMRGLGCARAASSKLQAFDRLHPRRHGGVPPLRQSAVCQPGALLHRHAEGEHGRCLGQGRFPDRRGELCSNAKMTEETAKSILAFFIANPTITYGEL